MKIEIIPYRTQLIRKTHFQGPSEWKMAETLVSPCFSHQMSVRNYGAFT